MSTAADKVNAEKAEEAKIAELTAIIRAVSERARARYPEGDSGNGSGIRIPVADLMPVVHARDAAQAKIAAIGSVNPRAGGLANRVIQAIKKLIARSLQWFVRDQIVFNRETISAVEALTEALNEHNRILVSLAAQTNEQLGYVRAELAERVRDLSAQTDARAREISAALARDLEPVKALVAQTDALKAEVQELKDIRTHWAEWRTGWEQKLATNEIQFLRSAADLQGAFQHRVTQIEANFRDNLKEQHANYLGALDRTNLQIQEQLREDMRKLKAEYDRMIFTELRLLRQRGLIAQSGHAEPPAPTPVSPSEQPSVPAQFDYARFAERFRGPEEVIRSSQAFYKPIFAGCGKVVDLGCGRGEFLESMREEGIAAKGIELSFESVEACRQKGLEAEQADMFEYLASLPDGELDGILCSQVIEHLPPARLPQLVNLCAAKLARGGVVAFETPNPECLAIFATYFYLDPTHTRPVPPPFVEYLMEEAGLSEVQVHYLAPAVDSMPELAELPPKFRDRFFGALDYAIVGRKL